MRLKKLISAVASLAIASSAFAGLTANAANESSVAAVKSLLDINESYINEVSWETPSEAVATEEPVVNLYTQNFEGVELSEISYSLNPSNTTARLLTNTAGNATTFFNYYTSGAGGDRASTVPLPEAYGEDSLVRVSMLMRMTGSNTNGSVFELRGSNNAAIWKFSALSYASSPKINDNDVTLSISKIGAVLGPSDYQSTGWLKFDATVDFSKSPAVVNLVVTDTTNGDSEVYSSTYTTTATNIKTVYGIIGRSNGAFAFDDIVIDRLPLSSSATTYTVTYNVHGVETLETVEENDSVASIPETGYNGYIFQGWNKDSNTETVYTTEQIAAMPITANTTFTAVYTEDDTYIEAISTVAISGTDSMSYGSDADTAATNAYSVVITGADGTTITENNISENVDDFNVVWDIDGFKTENDVAGQYLDSYGEFSVNNAAAVATTFDVKGGISGHNYYGVMSAVVTYNGDTYTATKPVVALGNTTTDKILPTGGYPSDIDTYPSSLVGYELAEETYGSTSDLIVGGWCMAGSDSGKSAVIFEESTNKFVRITSATASKSHVLTHSISAPASQVIFEQDIRFNTAGGVITLTSRYPIYSSSSAYKNPLTLSYDGTNVKLNGTALTKNDAAAAIGTKTWYHIVLSFDKASGICYAIVSDMSGNELGRAENVDLADDGSPTFYSVGMGNSNIGSIDFDNYSAYYPTADTDTYSIAASGETTIQIPETGTTDVTLSASLETADGYPMTGVAIWTADAKGVAIEVNESNSHEATVTVSSAAEAGEVPVTVSIGGYTKTITLILTSNAESIKFNRPLTSISIPLNDTNAVAEYAAAVVDGSGENVPGKTVSFAVYDKTNTNVITLPAGITFENGILTVTKDAQPIVFCIRATSTNTDNETISKAVKVTVHGLSFDFGAGTDDDLADGYTAVTPTTAYSSTTGYGISAGNATVGGTDSTEAAQTDYLEGAITFKADVERGNIYSVTIVYQGTLVTGYVNSDLSGYELGTNESLTEKTYTVPVVEDTLDLILSGDGAKIASVTITKNAPKTATAIPKIMHVGDSTSANNGSWAYVLKNTYGSYPEFAQYATFTNYGAGGRNLSTYYTQGKLAGVLRDINPGDIVMFGNNGTNGMGSFFEDDVNYYLDAAETMGAKIIINSYTPHGAVGNYASRYDSTTNTFNSYRTDSYDVIVRKVAAEREASDENYLGFVEIGKNADAAFNAYVADYAANGYASADAAAQAIIACFSDHNHYSEGSVARTLMLDGYGDVKGIVEQLVDILSAEPEDDTFTVNSFTLENGSASAAVTNNTNAAVPVTVIVAVYAANGTLVSAELNTKIVGAGESDDLSVTNSDSGNVKAFLWNMSNGTSLAEKLPE